MILTAPAKLTLSLRVTGRRCDGLHLIEAEMVTVDLTDTVEVTDTGDGDHESHLEVEGPYAEGVPTGPANLVLRALNSVGRSARVRLHKRIPHGAGLGGGSADAAAILRWAGCSDRRLALALGADVVFCLVGGHARVSGIGDVVEPLAPVARTFTLMTPDLVVHTPAVYRAWDDLSSRRDGDTTASWSQTGNDLEPAALVVAPELAGWRDQLGEATGVRPRLAGSGATWFVEGAFPGVGRTVVRTWNPPEG